MQLAVLAAFAALFGLAEPAVAQIRDELVRRPGRERLLSGLAHGTYAKYGLDVTIVPGGPQTNGTLMLLFGRIDFFMARDLMGDFMSAESKLLPVAVRRLSKCRRS